VLLPGLYPLAARPGLGEDSSTLKGTNMKLLTSLCILTGLVLSLGGQEAKIMIVEKTDSAKLSRAYKEYKDALKRWEDVKTEVSAQYTAEKGKPLAGWEKVQFSADFRAIVPTDSQYAGRGYTCNSLLNWPSYVDLTGSTPAVVNAGNIPLTGAFSDLDVAPITTTEKHK
jgi:hypothetical protein